MKILFGTSNPAKLNGMRDMLYSLDIELIGLNELNSKIIKVEESGNDPLENAILKAASYYKQTQMPVFSCDSGLYIDGLPDDVQPGVFIRRVNGAELNDEQMISHYTSLVRNLGGKVTARYKNAICFVKNENEIYKYDGYEIHTHRFILSTKAHSKKVPGFPLDSISIDISSGKYYYDLQNILSSDEYDSLAESQQMRNGFVNFFKASLSL